MTNTIAFIFASASEKNPARVLSDYDKKIGSYDTLFLFSKEKNVSPPGQGHGGSVGARSKIFPLFLRGKMFGLQVRAGQGSVVRCGAELSTIIN